MDIAFRARNIEIPELVRSRTLERVTRLGRALATDREDVCFTEERNPRIAERAVCEITLCGRRILRAQAAATDPAVAAGRVLEKLRHRTERLRGRPGSVHFGADRQGASDPLAAPAVRGRAGDVKIDAMTPEEAALEMALLRYDFYFFINAETAEGAVVYRRVDGNVGLVARLAAPGPKAGI